MRLPYVANPPVPATEEEAAIVRRIQARRAPRPLQPLDLALLHSPPVADGWNAFLGAVRSRTGALRADLREVAVARVAAVTRAWYEWAHHAPLAERAGVSPAGLAFVLRGAAAAATPLVLAGEGRQDGPPPEGLTEEQWAVVCYADEMTRNVRVRDETFARVRELLGERGVVELTATVGAPARVEVVFSCIIGLPVVYGFADSSQVACYNCVSRFLVALDGESSHWRPPCLCLVSVPPRADDDGSG